MCKFNLFPVFSNLLSRTTAVLTFETVGEIVEISVAFQMKATEQCFCYAVQGAFNFWLWGWIPKL